MATLPSLNQGNEKQPERQTLRATGTDDITTMLHAGKNRGKTGGKSVPFGAVACYHELKDGTSIKPAPDAESPHESSIAPDRDRTCDLRFRKPFAQNQKPLNLAENLEAENSSAELALKIEPKTAPDSAIADEDLRQLIDRWPSLAPAIRRGILAMVKS